MHITYRITILLSFFLLPLSLVVHCQETDYTGMPDDYRQAEEEPVFFISLNAGPSIPRGTLSNGFEFRDSPSGFARTGVAADLELNYHLDPVFGITAKYRFAQFQQNESAIQADLSRNKIGEFTANVDPWRFHTVAIGPHFSMNNSSAFLNFFIAPAFAFASLPEAQLHSKVDFHNTDFSITHNTASSKGFVFTLGGSFKYIFNDRWGLSMSVDYIAGNLSFNGLEYQSPDSPFNPDFEERLNIGYSSITAQTGIFFYINQSY